MADYRFPGEHIYENMVLEPSQREESVEKVKDLEVVDGDILVASYPKTGTTWMEEITWLVTNDADTETASKNVLPNRMFFLEHVHSFYEGKAGIDHLKDAKRPTVMKTHLPANIVAKAINSGKVKVIVTVRNPKDTLVSLYHFYRMNHGLGNFTGTWEEFFELYKVKHLLYGDYFDWYESWLPFMDRENVQMYKYEDMKADIGACIARLTKYLGVDLKPGQVQKIIEFTSFGSMKANKMVNCEEDVVMKTDISPFIRKGEVGDWKNYFTPEQNKLVEEDYKAKLESKGLVMRFE